MKIAQTLYHTLHAPAPVGARAARVIEVCLLTAVTPDAVANNYNQAFSPLPFAHFLLSMSQQTSVSSSVRGTSLSFVLGGGRNIFRK